MNVLITGHHGYVGPVVAQRLSGGPFAVRGADIGLFALPSNADVRDWTADALQGVEAVVHLAALSNDPIGDRFETLTDEINHRASVRLATLARSAGCKRFTYASSCSVYGQAEGLATEASQVNPLTAYARSKRDTEVALQALSSDRFSVACLRFATACGASPGLRLDLVLNDFVARAIVERKITILSDGTPWRPLIHVEDMARAIEWTLTKAAEPYRVLNIGSDAWNYRVVDLAEAVAAALPGTDISVNKDAAPDRRSYRVGFDAFAASAPPESRPQIGLAEAVGDIAAGVEDLLARLTVRPTTFGELAAMAPNVVRLRKIVALQDAGALSADLRWADASVRAA